MAGENTETKTEGTPGANGGGDQPKPEVKVAPKEEPKKEPAGTAPKEETPAPKKPEPKTLGEDEEIPEDAELFTLSRAALQKRLARNTKREIRERFGTDNLEEIQKKLDAAKKYEEDQEKVRRAQLSREEKLKEDLAKEKQAREAAEAKWQQAQDAREIAEVDTTATSILSKYVDPDAMDLAVVKLKKHVLSLDDDDLAKPEKVIEAWAKEFVEKSPKYAKPAEEGDQTTEIALDTGTKPKRPEPMKGDQTKTPKPGQQNSMSRAEYAAYKRRMGLGG